MTPKTITYKVQDGILKDEVERTGKEGMVREIEAGVIMDIKTAKIFKDWLEKRIIEHDQFLKGEAVK